MPTTLEPIEFRLASKTAAVTELVKAVNRHIKSKPLLRVEVRFSSQAAQGFDADRARQELRGLLSEHGHVGTAVSVRPIELPIQDAFGEHIVRLYPKPPAPRQDGWPQRLGERWSGWWTARGSKAPANSRTDEPTLGAPAATPAPAAASAPAISATIAAHELRKALLLALKLRGKQAGAAAAIHAVSITVRNAELHRALAPLVGSQQDHTARWVREELQKQRAAFDPALATAYRYQAPGSGQFTELADGNDLEIVFDASVEATEPTAAIIDDGASHDGPLVDVSVKPEASDATGPSPMPPQTSSGRTMHSEPTLMATDETALAAGALVRIKVLGTTDGPFDQPFEFDASPLPVRLDRAMFEASGFGLQHRDALRVVSQSCPLLIDQDAAGRLCLSSPGRPLDNGHVRAMYHDSDTGVGIMGSVCHDGDEAGVMVNGPRPVLDPTTGRRLAPLLLCVRLA